MAERLHAVVEGSVQGVAFRYYARRSAVSLGLTGWIRNLADGRVEAVAEGERPALEEFLGFLRRGPTMARVSRVEVIWEKATGEFDGFGVEPTSFL